MVSPSDEALITMATEAHSWLPVKWQLGGETAAQRRRRRGERELLRPPSTAGLATSIVRGDVGKGRSLVGEGVAQFGGWRSSPLGETRRVVAVARPRPQTQSQQRLRELLSTKYASRRSSSAAWRRRWPMGRRHPTNGGAGGRCCWRCCYGSSRGLRWAGRDAGGRRRR